MSRDFPPNEVLLVKDPGLAGVGRWNDIDQIDRRPREVRVSDQYGIHRQPQIAFDQLFSVENDHHIVFTCKPSWGKVPIVERWEGREVRMSAIISALVSTGDETNREDVLELLELCLMTNARDQVKMTRVDLGVDRVVGDELGNVCAVPALTAKPRTKRPWTKIL